MNDCPNTLASQRRGEAAWHGTVYVLRGPEAASRCHDLDKHGMCGPDLAMSPLSRLRTAFRSRFIGGILGGLEVSRGCSHDKR